MLIEGKDKRIVLPQSAYTGFYYLSPIDFLIVTKGHSAIIDFLKSSIFVKFILFNLLIGIKRFYFRKITLSLKYLFLQIK